ncbi:MAG: PAS domain S-box protein [Rhodospirillales bacterium]
MSQPVSRLTSVLIQLVVTLALVALAVGGGTIGLLYDAGIKDHRKQLLALTVNAAALIDSTYRNEELERRNEADFSFKNNITEIIRISSNAVSKFHDTGQSGTVIIGQRLGNDLTVLMHENLGDSQPDKVSEPSRSYAIPADSERARSIISALHGNTGTNLTEDEMGHKVIEAYAPIKSLGLALIMQIRVSEINTPFIKAILHSLLLAALFVGLGVFFIYRQTLPVFERVVTSETRFMGFVETATEWFWEMGRNLRFKSMGKGGRFGPNTDKDVYLGRTRAEIAATAEDVTTQKWIDHHNDLQNRRPFKDFQYDMIIEGERRTLSVSGMPVFGENGEFQGYQGTGRDVTDLIRDKRRIEEAEERLRGAFENITMAIILINERGIIESFNPMAEQVFGYKATETIGKNVSMLMPEPDRGQHNNYLRAYIFGGPAKIIGIGREVHGLRKNGEQFPMHLGVAEMMLRGQRHFVGSIIDLSATKAIEHQLRRAQKMDAIGQLTGGIAHDFNNLLGIIIGNLDLVLRKLDPENDHFKRISNALKGAERGAALTGRLLNFSRQTPESNEILDANAVLRDIRKLVEHSITSAIEFKLILLDEACPVRINKSDFEDALINLTVNARDAMPDGGVLTIETRHTGIDGKTSTMMRDLPAGEYIEVSISDNGCGMTPEVINRIFEPFYTTKAAGEGTGLGMSLVYGFIQRSKGAIKVYSEPGFGTTFKIYLPRTADTADGESRGVAGKKNTESEIVVGTETILIVDDEADLADMARAILEECGYRIHVAHSAAGALQILDDTDDIDMLLTDIIMPGMNGFELAELAIEKKPTIKVLASSGFSGNTSKVIKRKRDGLPILRKPYNYRELALEVRRVLDSPRQD